MLSGVAYQCYINRPVPSSRRYIDSDRPLLQPATDRKEEHPLLSLGRALIMTPTYLFARGYLKLTTKITVIDGHKLQEAVDQREEGEWQSLY